MKKDLKDPKIKNDKGGDKMRCECRYFSYTGWRPCPDGISRYPEECEHYIIDGDKCLLEM